MLSTFVPIVGIIGRHKNYSKQICNNIKLELEHLFSWPNKLTKFIKKLTLFLKIVVHKPYVEYNITECIHYFLYIRTSMDPKTNLVISHFNYGNTILYKMITLYFREYRDIIDYPLEFDDLINNQKAKLIISIAQKNLDRRVNICKYTCSQCHQISFKDILQNCACDEVQFCSQDCLDIAWPSHKKTCKKNIKSCFGCHLIIDKILKCSRCQIATYCSKACQKEHWDDHKKTCKKDKLH